MIKLIDNEPFVNLHEDSQRDFIQPPDIMKTPNLLPLHFFLKELFLFIEKILRTRNTTAF